MWNGKYVSVRQIIASVYRMLQIQEDNYNFGDLIEWAGEAIELIGAPYSLKEVVRKIPVKEYRACIPIDLHLIETVKGISTEQVEVEEEACSSKIHNYFPMRYSTDSFHHHFCKESNDHLCQSQHTYTVNDHYFNTSFEYGVIAVAYQALPVDNEGLPLIPDQIKFRKAVQYYIMTQIAESMFIQGRIPQATHYNIEQKYLFYVGAAQNAFAIPNIDLAESIKNNWLRLIPKINQHSNSFSQVGEPEQRIVHNAYGSYSHSSPGNNDKVQDHYFYVK